MLIKTIEFNPLVSVLIRSMDRGSLSDALASVATQTYPFIELVLVNAKGEGHRDVGERCGTFPIHFISSAARLSRSAAANKGLEMAGGEYLLFLDDDDLIDAEHIETLVRTLDASRNFKAAFSGTRVTNAAGQSLGVYNSAFSEPQLLVGNFLPIHAVLFSKELVLAGCRFDNSLETYEDWDFWLQVSRHTDFVQTGVVSAVYRSFLGDSGMSSAEDRPLQRLRRSVVWRKWWPEWTVESLNLLTSALEKAQDEKEKESTALRGAFNDQVNENSKLHHTVATLQQAVGEKDHQLAQTVAEFGYSLADLNAQLADRERVLSIQNAQIIALNSSIQEILTSTSWKFSAPVRHIGRLAGIFRRRMGSARVRAHLAFQYLQRKFSSDPVESTFLEDQMEGELAESKRLLKPVAPTSMVSTARGLEPSPAVLMQRHDHQSLASIDIDRYDYFFLDVFDTAVIRLFEKPVDLFKYLEHSTQFANFERMRTYMEGKARERYGTRKDIKLLEIYQNFHGVDQKQETDAELTFCVAHPETLAFYAELVSKNKKIFFVSDMYLDRATIAMILHKNGFLQYEDIFVSSEDDLIKGDGSRFAWLKSVLPDSLGKAIHIGDNHVSDWVQPRLQGYDALQFMESIDFYQYDEFLFSKAPHLIAQSSFGVSFLLGMFRYWKSGFVDKQPGYWKQFGFLYGGALVAAFCGFVNGTVLKNKYSTSRVFFLARDGDIMSRVFRLLYPELDAVYLLASRRCMSFPSLNTMEPLDDEDMLKLFTTPIGITCAQDIIDRLGYDDMQSLKDALADLESRGLIQSEPDVLRCFVEHKDTILAKAFAERHTLLQYLDEVNFFQNPDIVIADVGWGGTIQNALVKLMERSGHGDQKLHGLYMGVSDSVEHKDYKTGFLFQGDKSRFDSFLNLIELITSSPKDGVVRIAAVEGSYVPVSVKQTAEELHRQSIAAEIQAGILEFAQIVKDKKIGNLDFFKPQDFEALFEALQEHPSEEDVAHLGTVRHAMTLGSHFGEKVLNRKG
ncbi:MAG: glycosyltransferase [Rhodoferax sp.]